MKRINFIMTDEFLDFVDGLSNKDGAKLLRLIYKIEDLGLQTAIKMQWIKKLDNNLYEIRSKVSSNIQRALYFHVVEENYLITNGFTKKTQKTPQREIEHAKRIKEDYLKELDKHENN